MAIGETIRYVSVLLDQIITRQPSDVLQGVPKKILTIAPDAELLGGMFTYARRSVIPGRRLLTPDITTQPGLGIKVGDQVTSIAYAEDVLRHPLQESIVYALESLVV